MSGGRPRPQAECRSARAQAKPPSPQVRPPKLYLEGIEPLSPRRSPPKLSPEGRAKPPAPLAKPPGLLAPNTRWERRPSRPSRSSDRWREGELPLAWPLGPRAARAARCWGSRALSQARVDARVGASVASRTPAPPLWANHLHGLNRLRAVELQPLYALEAAMGCAIVSRRTPTPQTATMLRPRCALHVSAMLLAIVSR